jgi:hypothetical protein
MLAWHKSIVVKLSVVLPREFEIVGPRDEGMVAVDI